MKKELIFGNRDSRLCMATQDFRLEGEHSIALNNREFWISECIFDYRVFVQRETPVGKKINSIIETTKDYKKVYDYINKEILKKIPYQDFLVLIEEEKKKGFEEGMESKAREFRKVLGIGEY